MQQIENSNLIISTNIDQNLDFITKEYKEIKLKPNKLYKKKIKYNNSEDFDKEIEVISTDSIVKIKTEKLKLDFKSMFLMIRLKIYKV